MDYGYLLTLSIHLAEIPTSPQNFANTSGIILWYDLRQFIWTSASYLVWGNRKPWFLFYGLCGFYRDATPHWACSWVKIKQALWPDNFSATGNTKLYPFKEYWSIGEKIGKCGYVLHSMLLTGLDLGLCNCQWVAFCSLRGVIIKEY